MSRQEHVKEHEDEETVLAEDPRMDGAAETVPAATETKAARKGARSRLSSAGLVVAGVGGFAVDLVSRMPQAPRATRRGLQTVIDRLRDRGSRLLGQSPTTTIIDLNTMTVTQLREVARDHKVRGRSQMDKDELIKALATRN
jgi:hypothetical protein